MILGDILTNKRDEVKRSKSSHPLEELLERIENLPPTKNFTLSLKSDGEIRIIAEVKCASPSKGIFREGFDPVSIARGYEAGGASAISVLTDEKFFKGNLNHLLSVREEVQLPILRKDFTIDPYQIYEARAWGGDAVLLIASILETEEIREFIQTAKSLGMGALVEVHDESELEKALRAGAEIIGINNRDLRTFEVDIEVSVRLSRLIPDGKVVVSESGINSPEQIKRLKKEGIYVFLIGEAFMRSKSSKNDIEKILRECS